MVLVPPLFIYIISVICQTYSDSVWIEIDFVLGALAGQLSLSLFTPSN